MKTAGAIEAKNSVQEPIRAPKKKRKIHPRSLANLIKPWKPGQSGNPAGKNGRDVAQEIAKAVFGQNPELIYRAFAKALHKGNAYAFQVLSDRAFGKLKETKEVTHRYEDVPDTDLQRRIDELLRDLGLAEQVDDSGATAGAEAGTSAARKQA